MSQPADDRASAPVTPSAASARPPATVEPDWATRAVDMLDGVVGAVRDRTTVPITTAARAAVYGLLALVMGAVALVLLAVALVRAVDVAIPGPVWSAHLVVGGVFCLAGLFLWTKRRPKEREDT